MTASFPRPTRSATALILALLLTACSVGDAYEQPPVGMPLGWKYTDQAIGESWPAADWWKNFKAKPLEDLMAEALAANTDIQAAIANVRAADAELKEAGSALLPQVSGNGGVTRAQTPALHSGTKPTIADTYTAAVSASYQVDFWGKNRAAVEAASATAQGTRYDQETTILTVTSSVATTYFTIIGTWDRLAAAHKNLDDSKQLLETYRKRFKAGTASDLDLATQENLVATEAALLPPLEQTLRQNCDALAILAGRLPETIDFSTLMVPHGLAGIALPEVGAGLPSGLLERRPDVLAAEESLIAANANITVARANFFPDITLTGQYGFESAALASLFTPASVLYSIAASATQPIFTGGLLEGALEYQQATYDSLVATYRKSVLSAFGDVEDALAATTQTAAAEKAQKEAVATAQKTYDLTKAELTNGTVDITSVLTAERSLFSAEDAYIQARIAHFQAIVQLYNALGGGWQNPPKAVKK